MLFVQQAIKEIIIKKSKYNPKYCEKVVHNISAGIITSIVITIAKPKIFVLFSNEKFFVSEYVIEYEDVVKINTIINIINVS